MLITTYISELCHLGHHIYTGKSWLLLTLDSNEDVLAFVRPITGVFTLDRAHFFDLTLYPGVTVPKGTPTRRINISAQAQARSYRDVVSLDEIVHLISLWPQKQATAADGSELWSFVEL